MSNIIAITGLPGRGKTATAVYVAFKLYHKRGRKVISNTPLAFAWEELPVPQVTSRALPPEWDAVIGDPDNLARRALVLFDEAHSWVDARESMTMQNIVLTEFITQLRKRGLDMLYTTQDWAYVDRRLRRLTTAMVYCQTVRRGVMVGRLYEDPWNRPDQRGQVIMLDVKPVFSLFDTYHRIKRVATGPRR